MMLYDIPSCLVMYYLSSEPVESNFMPPLLLHGHVPPPEVPFFISVDIAVNRSHFTPLVTHPANVHPSPKRHAFAAW